MHGHGRCVQAALNKRDRLCYSAPCSSVAGRLVIDNQSDDAAPARERKWSPCRFQRGTGPPSLGSLTATSAWVPESEGTQMARNGIDRVDLVHRARLNSAVCRLLDSLANASLEPARAPRSAVPEVEPVMRSATTSARSRRRAAIRRSGPAAAVFMAASLRTRSCLQHEPWPIIKHDRAHGTGAALLLPTTRYVLRRRQQTSGE